MPSGAKGLTLAEEKKLRALGWRKTHCSHCRWFGIYLTVCECSCHFEKSKIRKEEPADA